MPIPNAIKLITQYKQIFSRTVTLQVRKVPEQSVLLVHIYVALSLFCYVMGEFYTDVSKYP